MHRRPGLSARLKLTLSYAGFLAVAGALLLAVVWVFLLRYVPNNPKGLLGISPNRYLLVHTFAPAAAVAMVFLLVFGLVGDGSSPAGCSHPSPRSRMRHGWPGTGRCPTGSA